MRTTILWLFFPFVYGDILNCTITDGTQLQARCKCGDLTCDEEHYCEKRINVPDICHHDPLCIHVEYENRNNQQCRCGTNICMNSQYCLKNESRCSFYGSPGGLFVNHRNKIRQRISSGLKKSCPRIRELMTMFKDADGFVRPGIYFCGSDSVHWPLPSNFSTLTYSLGSNDGYSRHDESMNQCGYKNCHENSFVSILASYINTFGYRIRHGDICEAISLMHPVIKARTCNLRANNVDRRAFRCNETVHETMNDWWQVNKRCYFLSKSECHISEECDFDVLEDYCRASESFMSEICNYMAEETIFSSSNANEIWSVLGYSVNEDSIWYTDKAFVTGSVPGECNTLRSLFNALNGNAQISAFRDSSLDEAARHWWDEIGLIRSSMTSLIYKLRNFRDISKSIFPFIEEEDIVGCPMGVREYESTKTGTKTEPLCERDRFRVLSDMNEHSESSQYLYRTECFCRNGELDMDYGKNSSRYELHEFDQIYLSYDDHFDCEKYADTLPSVYTYCRKIKGWGDRAQWRSTLKEIKVRPERIYIYSNVRSVNHKRRNAIAANLERTLPEKEFTCGRVITADSEGVHKYSNKGGNCVPFRKMHEILYRLEFETSTMETGKTTMNHEYGYDAEVNATLYADYFCDMSDTFETNKFSFRQMSYLWDHIQGGDLEDRNISATNLSAKFRPNRYTPLPPDWRQVESTRSYFYRSHRYVLPKRDFCFIDWINNLLYSDPDDDHLGLNEKNKMTEYSREIDEAIWNTELAYLSKKKVKIDNEELWSIIEKQLTEIEDSNLLNSISESAAKHYLKVS